MKTAIQEAISQLKEFRDDEMDAGWEGEAYAYDTAISILKDLLKKEKEQTCGFVRDFIDDKCYASFDGYVQCNGSLEDYYDQTFNPDEK
jgi:hypothetical protein